MYLESDLFEPLEVDDQDVRKRPQTEGLDGALLASSTVGTVPRIIPAKLQAYIHVVQTYSTYIISGHIYICRLTDLVVLFLRDKQVGLTNNFFGDKQVGLFERLTT